MWFVVNKVFGGKGFRVQLRVRPCRTNRDVIKPYPHPGPLPRGEGKGEGPDLKIMVQTGLLSKPRDKSRMSEGAVLLKNKVAAVHPQYEVL